MSINRLELDFNDDCLIAITGANGSGKSSLLYAVACCLSGYKKGESYRDYVMSGHDTAEIHLDAELYGLPLVYDITLNAEGRPGTPMNRKVVYKGVEYINSDYAQFIKEYDLTYLESLMFLFQGTNNIIDVRPADRANTLKKLFKYDFSDIVQKFRDNQERYKDSNIEANALINELKSRKFETLPLLRESMPQAIDNWAARLEEINTSVRLMGDIDEQALQNCIDSIKATERKIKDAERKSELETVERSKCIASKTKTEQFLSLPEHSDAAVKESLAKAKQLLDDHKLAYDEKKARYTELNGNLKVKTYAMDQLKAQIEISKTGKCPSCGQPVGEDHLAQLCSTKDIFVSEIETLNSEIKALEYDPKDALGKKLQASILEAENLISTVRLDRETLERTVKRIADIDASLKEREDYLRSLNESKAILEAKKARLEETENLVKQKESLEAEKLALEQKLDKSKRDSITNVERRKTNESIIRQSQERDAKVQELSAKLNDVMAKISNTKTIIDVFENSFPNFLVLQAAKILEDYINSIIQRVFPNMKVKLSQQRSGVNFYYMVDDESDDWLSISMASGAQKQVLTLAYSISLARMYGLNCILLDEVDASLSPANAEIIYDFIAGLDHFNQTIFISHRKESIEAAKDINPNTICYSVENGEYTLL